MEPIAAPLLQWFNANKRLLPFRQEPSAYHIWVSEIMLQQTRVAAAIPYYERFIAALPNPAALAACEPDALRKLWQGLGYYNRVNNMQKAARIVCEQYGGDLPADYDALRSLPGIGDYTAGAVASIAFGIPAPAVDGNVLRVFARLYNDDADVMAPATKKAFTVRVLDQMPKATPGPYNEALMELGALVCIPGTPHCEECPLADLCRGYAAGRADQLPVKPAPKAKGKVPVTVALIESEQGLLLQRRPARGLLAGLWQPAAWEKALTRDELTAALAGIGVQAVLDEPLTLAPMERALVPTGLAIELPGAHTVALVYARSGLSIKHGLCMANGVGVVDSDYRGELKVPMINLGTEAYTIQPGERVAQLCIAPVYTAAFAQAAELGDTQRGAGGFGSTGK